MFKSIYIPNKCLLLAIEYGKDMLSISAVRAANDHQSATGHGKSSSFTPPCATQQHSEARLKSQDFSLALLFEADVPAPSNHGICLSKHQISSITSDTVIKLSLLEGKQPVSRVILKSLIPYYCQGILTFS